MKRPAFSREREVRLLYFGDAADFEVDGPCLDAVDRYALITQIMTDHEP